MRKLLIADDEKIIRETIASLIDWNALGIELIGAAKDGIEAYNIILDEYPDIVLTDIKMPGFSGLELIQRIHEISKDTRFIILSGYGEFEYAKKAMQYGVKHYLLKPCNEEQIVKSLKEVMNDFTDFTTDTGEQMPEFIKGYHGNLMTGILNNSLSLASHTCDDYANIYKPYKKYMDFDSIPYDVFYVYYIPPTCFDGLTDKIRTLINKYFPKQIVYFIYVRNTLVFFMKATSEDSEDFYLLLDALHDDPQTPAAEYKKESFPNLSATMMALMQHLRKYEQINFSEGSQFVSLYNYQNIIKEVQLLTEQLYSEDTSAAESARKALFHTFSSVSDAGFLKQLAASCVIFSVSKNRSFDMVKAAEFLVYLGQETDCGKIAAVLIQQINALYEDYHSDKSLGDISRKIQNLVEEHIGNSELSLKWIAENYLFMNVDYLSKRFLKETGLKFSKYLTDVRISHAKEILASQNTDSIQDVADLVGCGNNPQYFSQIFKKSTGMTPSKYAKMITGSPTNNLT